MFLRCCHPGLFNQSVQSKVRSSPSLNPLLFGGFFCRSSSNPPSSSVALSWSDPTASSYPGHVRMPGKILPVKLRCQFILSLLLGPIRNLRPRQHTLSSSNARDTLHSFPERKGHPQPPTATLDARLLFIISVPSRTDGAGGCWVYRIVELSRYRGEVLATGPRIRIS